MGDAFQFKPHEIRIVLALYYKQRFADFFRVQDIGRVAVKVFFHPVGKTVAVQVLFLQEYEIIYAVIEQVGSEGEPPGRLAPEQIKIGGLLLAQPGITNLERRGRQVRAICV